MSIFHMNKGGTACVRLTSFGCSLFLCFGRFHINFRFARVEDAKALQHYEDLCNENNEYDIIPFRNQFKNMEAYLNVQNDWHREKQLGNGMVPSSLYVLEDKGEILGTLVIRHRLNDFLELHIGHIGYRVSPCHRQKGYAV